MPEKRKPKKRNTPKLPDKVRRDKAIRLLEEGRRKRDAEQEKKHGTRDS